MTILIASLVAVALMVALLSIKVICTKTKTLSSAHVGAQPALRDKGISCHTSQHHDAQRHRNLKERLSMRGE